MIAAQTRSNTISKHQRHKGDTGSPEVQVALLTARIGELTEHLKGHVKDHASRRGLVMMVGKRNRLLRYLGRSNHDSYQSLIRQLGLRK